ncbi:hypothetical protein MCEMSE15_00190 [Fimbriimonadaceae bacterium]
MKFAATLLILVGTIGLACSSGRVEKYSLRPTGPEPETAKARFSFSGELEKPVDDLPSKFSLSGRLHTSIVGKQADGAYTRRTRYKIEAASPALEPDDEKEWVTESFYDRNGNKIKAAKSTEGADLPWMPSLNFEPPAQDVAVGDAWTTVNPGTPDSDEPASFGASQLAGIEMVSGTKCFRVEQVFRSGGAEPKLSYSTVWIRQSDGSVLKVDTAGSVRNFKDSNVNLKVAFSLTFEG